MKIRSISRRAVVIHIAVTISILVSNAAMAQMDQGPKTEKTFGIGLPRDHASQLFSDKDYPVFPLKPGQEAYRDIDGARMKKDVIALSQIALRYRDTVNKQWWGRFPGTDADKAGMKYMTDEFARLGLKVESFPYVLPKDWRPQSWNASYTTSNGSKIELVTAFPVSGTKGTGSDGITAEALWVGVGAEPDFLARRQGQGRYYLQHLRSRRPQSFGFRSCWSVQRQCAGAEARRGRCHQCHGGSRQRSVPTRRRTTQHSANDRQPGRGLCAARPARRRRKSYRHAATQRAGSDQCRHGVDDGYSARRV